MNCPYSVGWFPLIKLAKKLKDQHQKKVKVQNRTFPLIKLAKKLKDSPNQENHDDDKTFPLIKLAKKLKDKSSKEAFERPLPSFH
jgi:hypothetical protein